MVAGAFSAQGVPYNYRSAARTAINPLANGTQAYAITMVDVATPINSRTQSGFTVIINNTAPAPVDMTTANRIGGTVGRAEQGDSLTYTWSTPIDPESLLSGWDGGSPTTVTVRIKNMGPNDRLTVEGPAGTLNFGVVALQAELCPRNAGLHGLGHHDDREHRRDRARVPNGAVNTVTVATPTTWQGDNAAYGASGNPCSTDHDHRLGLAPDRLLGGGRERRSRPSAITLSGVSTLHRSICRRLGCGRLGSGSRIVGSPTPFGGPPQDRRPEPTPPGLGPSSLTWLVIVGVPPRRILPDAVRGSSVIGTTARGSLNRAIRRHRAHGAPRRAGGSSPLTGTTNATTCCPHSSCALPATATPSTIGWSRRASSTSCGHTVSAPVLMASSDRPSIRRLPSGSSRSRIARAQPPSSVNATAVAPGSCGSPP